MKQFYFVVLLLCFSLCVGCAVPEHHIIFVGVTDDTLDARRNNPCVLQCARCKRHFSFPDGVSGRVVAFPDEEQ